MEKAAKDLDVMFQRVLVAPTTERDVVAMETICYIIKNDVHLAQKAVQKISDRLHSKAVTDVLQILDVLDDCMGKCGSSFQSEVGKFRFLNEMIKLVSIKHSAQDTPKPIRDKILDLLLIWTIQYPQEPKIKEAYDMLMKQGVDHEAAKSHRVGKSNDVAMTLDKRPVTDFDKIPKKLLLSTDPRDTQVANLLIEKMIEEDKRRTELQEKRTQELKKSIDITSLLNDMLHTYAHGEATSDEKAIMKELFTLCKSLHISISHCAADNDDLLKDALSANDILNETIKSYTQVVINGKKLQEVPNSIKTVENESNLLQSFMDAPIATASTKNAGSSFDDLYDIFSQETPVPPIVASSSELLQPVGAATATSQMDTDDLLSHGTAPATFTVESLLKKHNSNKSSAVFANRPKPATVAPSSEKMFGNLDLETVIDGLKTNLTTGGCSSVIADDPIVENKLVPSEDDALLGCLDVEPIVQQAPPPAAPADRNVYLRPLSEISIDIDAIRPGAEAPKTIMDDQEGLKIILYFAKDRPRDDVSVIVITTTNQNSKPITNYVFDVSISKPCKLRLLKASGESLPGIKPFRPPTEDITQVLLISNKADMPFHLVCIVSYNVDGDPDPVKESIAVTDLPHLVKAAPTA